MEEQKWARMAAAVLIGIACAGAHADWRPDAVQVQAGVGKEGAEAVAVGLAWDWSKERDKRFPTHTELIVSAWRADAVGGGHQALVQVAVVPVLRMVLDNGHSRWFLEGGIGASYLNKDYATPDKTFSTRWNFYDLLGFGYRFGDGHEHEIGARYVHISNGSFRWPNPGEDLFLLRYARRF